LESICAGHIDVLERARFHRTAQVI